MGIRETLNQNPRLTTGLTIAIIVVVVGLLGWQIWGPGSGGSSEGGPTNKRWFTEDDGKTWFADDYKKVGPIQHNGKEAFEAIVYKCDGKTFVNHLIRYTPDGKKRMEAILSGVAKADPSGAQTDQEVKSPGQKDWLKSSDPRAMEVVKPKCTNMETMEAVPAN